MTIPYLLVATYLGPGISFHVWRMIGLAIVVSTAKAGFLIPDKSEAWDFESPELWEREWSGEHQSAVEPQPKSMG